MLEAPVAWLGEPDEEGDERDGQVQRQQPAQPGERAAGPRYRLLLPHVADGSGRTLCRLDGRPDPDSVGGVTSVKPSC